VAAIQLLEVFRNSDNDIDMAVDFISQYPELAKETLKRCNRMTFREAQKVTDILRPLAVGLLRALQHRIRLADGQGINFQTPTAEKLEWDELPPQGEATNLIGIRTASGPSEYDDRPVQPVHGCQRDLPGARHRSEPFVGVRCWLPRFAIARVSLARIVEGAGSPTMPMRRSQAAKYHRHLTVGGIASRLGAIGDAANAYIRRTRRRGNAFLRLASRLVLGLPMMPQ